VASRTRNRALGIAALIVAVVAAVVILLNSKGADGQRVTPLPEDAARHEPYGELAEPDRPTRFRPPVPVPGALLAERRTKGKKRARNHKRSELRTASRRIRVKRHERTRRARSNRPPRALAIPAPPPGSTAPPVSGPTPPNATSPAARPSPTEPPAIQPSSLPKLPPADPRPVEAAIQEIEIEGGELEDDVERVRSSDGHVRLRIRTDELLLVELEDSALTWLVSAHGDVVIELDTPSSRGVKLDLRHRKGLLVLRVRD
jgi:hypothetical protein